MNSAKIFKCIIILLILSLVFSLTVSCKESKEDKIVLEELKALTLGILALHYLTEEIPKDLEEGIEGAKSSLDLLELLLEEMEKLHNNWLKEAEAKDEEIKGLKDEIELISVEPDIVEVDRNDEEWEVTVELTKENYGVGGILLDCPAPKPGFIQTGFTYTYDFVVKDYWGKDEPGPGGYVLIRTNTLSENYTTTYDEIVQCVYDPITSTSNSVTDEPGDWFDWESMELIQGRDYTDIDFAEVTLVDSDVVLTMELGGNIPYPETFIPEVSELEYFFALCPLPGFEEWPWYSPAYDGLECLPNAFIILIYENGSWRFGIDYWELGEMKTVILPEDNLQVEENTITMKAPLEALGNPSSFNWLSGTYIDGIADIAPN